MSYEGYEQHLCVRGHRFDVPCSYEAVCPCGAPSVWVNPVDDTNCDETGVIPAADWAKFRLTDEVVKTCDLGFQHVVEEATYRAPTDEERKSLQSYFNSDGTYVRCEETEKHD
jgi:hypothetical protein